MPHVGGFPNFNVGVHCLPPIRLYILMNQVFLTISPAAGKNMQSMLVLLDTTSQVAPGNCLVARY